MFGHPATTTCNVSCRQDTLIASTYVEMHDMLVLYVTRRIGLKYEAEDLVQEVFLRLLHYTTLLNETTIRSLVFAIARNCVVDWLRRHARSRAAGEYFFVHARRSHNEAMEEVEAHDVAALESSALSIMPQRRREVYMLCIHEGFSAMEVAGRMHISRRTAENHLFAARHEMREALKECI